MKTSFGLLTLTIASAVNFAEALPACNEETVQLSTENIVFAIIGGKRKRSQVNLVIECSRIEGPLQVGVTLERDRLRSAASVRQLLLFHV